MQPPLYRLMVILTSELCTLDPLETARLAIAGGADAIQLREKKMSTTERLNWGRELHALCQSKGVALIINDDLDCALALGATGAHVGQDDMHPEDVRKVARLSGRDDFVIGLSTHDLEQLDEAAEFGVDYAGFGPVFASPTKNYTQGLGPEYLAAALAIARVPVIAIGGIAPENAWMIAKQAGMAVSSAICGSQNPEETIRRFLDSRVS